MPKTLILLENDRRQIRINTVVIEGLDKEMYGLYWDGRE